MRRVLIISAALVIVGFGLILIAMIMGVAAGSIPYPDGPNAGYASPPGPRRWLEVRSAPTFVGGAMIMVIGCVSLVGMLGFRFVRGSWRSLRNESNPGSNS